MPVRDQALGLDQLRRLFRGAPGGAGEPPGAGIERAGIVKEPAIDAPLLRPEPEIDAGAYIEPAVPPGYPWVAGQGPGEPVIVKADRYPKPPMLIDRRVLSAGQAGVQWQVGFPINSMRIDNWSNQFLLIRGAEVYVPPFAYGAIVEITPATQTLEVMWEAPPGQAEPGVVVGQAAHVWLYEDKLTPSPGSVLDVAGAGGAIDVSDRAARLAGRVAVYAGVTAGNVDVRQMGSDGIDTSPYLFGTWAAPLLYRGDGTFDRQRTPSGVHIGSANAAGGTVVWAPASSKKYRLMGALIVVSGDATLAAAGALNFYLYDGSDGHRIGPDITLYLPAAIPAPAPAAAFSTGWCQFGNGFLGSVANATVVAVLSAALATGSIKFTMIGTEE